MATTTGDPRLPVSADQLDVLAGEVGASVEEELEREGRLDAVLGRVKAGAGVIASVPGRTRDKVAELVNAGLDRIYAAPMQVRSVDEAAALLDEIGGDSSGKETSRRIAEILAAAGPILSRVARGTGRIAYVAGVSAKFVPSGRAVALSTTAALATVRIGTSTRVGVRELQVLASFLVSRLRAEHLDVERSLVEQAVVQVYLDPDAVVSVRRGERAPYASLARMWTGRSFRPPSDAKRRKANRQRAKAVGRMDLHDLQRQWTGALPPPSLAR